MHCEGILSGELKHGPLAMIDEDMPCIMIIMQDNTYNVSYNVLYYNNRKFIKLDVSNLVLVHTNFALDSLHSSGIQQLAEILMYVELS